MKSQDQILLEHIYESMTSKKNSENQQPSPQEVYESFKTDVLDKYEYKDVGEGHLNCGWATRKMCKWGEQKGYKMEAIYFVWPKPETVAKLKKENILPKYYNDNGEAHIAPVYDNTIIDITVGQFDPQKAPVLFTPVDQWKGVYGKFGYGTNDCPKGSGKFVYIDTFDNIQNHKDLDMDDASKFSPPLKK